MRSKRPPAYIGCAMAFLADSAHSELRPARRRGRALAVVAVALLGGGAVALIAALALASSSGSTPPRAGPSVPPARRVSSFSPGSPVAAGTVRELSLYSASLRRFTRYDLYLPPHYAQQAARGRRFPVLYLLHSPAAVPMGILTRRSVAARADALTAQGRMRPLIIVVPLGKSSDFAGDTEWANTPAGPFDSYVVDVVRFIDHRYATLADRQHRGLGGVSMGGYGAVNVALNHLQLFSVAESWSGYFTQTATGPYIGASQAQLNAASPTAKLPSRTRLIRRLGLRVWLYQGNHDDVSASAMRAFARQLRKAGAQVRSVVYPGGHNWALWSGQMSRQLQAASEWFAQSPRPR